MRILVTSVSGANGSGYGAILAFGPEGGPLYCAGEDHVVAFDFRSGSFIGAVTQLARLNGQALVFVP